MALRIGQAQKDARIEKQMRVKTHSKSPPKRGSLNASSTPSAGGRSPLPNGPGALQRFRSEDILDDEPLPPPPNRTGALSRSNDGVVPRKLDPVSTLSIVQEFTGKDAKVARGLQDAEAARMAAVKQLARKRSIYKQSQSESVLVTSEVGVMWAPESVETKSNDKNKLEVAKKKEEMEESLDPMPEWLPWFTFHPNHPYKMAFDNLIGVCIIYSCIAVPLKIGFDLTTTTASITINSIVDFFFALDIIAGFRTVYIDDEGAIVHDMKKVAWRYATGWFLLDLVSTVPFDYIALLAATIKGGEADTSTSTLLRATKLLKILRLLRLLRLLKYAKLLKSDELKDPWLHPAVKSLLGMLTTLVFVAHILGCMWHWLAVLAGPENLNWCSKLGIQDEDKSLQYLVSLYWAFTTMTTVGYGDVTPATSVERVYAMMGEIIGAGTFGYIIGRVSAIFEHFDVEDAIESEKMEQITVWIHDRRFPTHLAHRMEKHFKFVFQATTVFDTGDILENLPALSATSITFSQHQVLINSVPLLARSSPMFVVSLLRILSPYLAFKGDVVFTQGFLASHWYLVKDGQIALIGFSDTPTPFRADAATGEPFGNEVLLEHPVYAVSAVAKVRSELRMVGRDQFLSLLHMWPVLRQQLHQGAQDLRKCVEENDHHDHDHSTHAKLHKSKMSTSDSSHKRGSTGLDGSLMKERSSKLLSVAEVSLMSPEPANGSGTSSEDRPTADTTPITMSPIPPPPALKDVEVDMMESHHADETSTSVVRPSGVTFEDENIQLSRQDTVQHQHANQADDAVLQENVNVHYDDSIHSIHHASIHGSMHSVVSASDNVQQSNDQNRESFSSEAGHEHIRVFPIEKVQDGPGLDVEDDDIDSSGDGGDLPLSKLGNSEMKPLGDKAIYDEDDEFGGTSFMEFSYLGKNKSFGTTMTSTHEDWSKAKTIRDDGRIDHKLFLSKTHMLYPEDIRKVGWDLFISALIVWSVVELTYRLTFNVDPHGPWIIWGFTVDSFFFLDIFFTFNTAVKTEDWLIICDRWCVARLYFSGWFLIDFVSTVPLDAIMEVAAPGQGGGGTSGTQLLKVFRLVRLMKLIRMLKAMTLFTDMPISPSVKQLTKLLVAMFFAAHLGACMWYASGSSILYDPDDPTNGYRTSWVGNYCPSLAGTAPEDKICLSQDAAWQQYIAAMYFAFTTMTTVGYGDITPDLFSKVELITAIAGEILATTVFAWIIGNVVSLVVNMDPAERNRKSLMSYLTEYIRDMKLTKPMKKSIRIHYSHQLNINSTFDQANYLQSLPPQLAFPATAHLYKAPLTGMPLICEVESECPGFLVFFLPLLKPALYRANDTITATKVTVREMGFITQGKVSVTQRQFQSEKFSPREGDATKSFDSNASNSPTRRIYDESPQFGRAGANPNLPNANPNGDVATAAANSSMPAVNMSSVDLMTRTEVMQRWTVKCTNYFGEVLVMLGTHVPVRINASVKSEAITHVLFLSHDAFHNISATYPHVASILMAKLYKKNSTLSWVTVPQDYQHELDNVKIECERQSATGPSTERRDSDDSTYSSRGHVAHQDSVESLPPQPSRKRSSILQDRARKESHGAGNILFGALRR